jgi:hypothetical protein
MRNHPVFHILLLEPASADAKFETILEIESDQEYEFEEVLAHRQKGRTTEYLIKWENYPPKENL